MQWKYKKYHKCKHLFKATNMTNLTFIKYDI